MSTDEERTRDSGGAPGATRNTPYTSIPCKPHQRDRLRDIRDAAEGMETWGDLFHELIQNAQEDLSNE
jgi:hypothetical protein